MQKYFFRFGKDDYEFSLSLRKFYDEENNRKFTRLQLRLPYSGQVLLHKFYQSDPEVFHDHPWDFYSLVLSREGFKEQVALDLPKKRLPCYKKYPWLSFRFHKAEKLHRVIVGDKPVWTLVFTGKVRRGWGYSPEKGKWVPWKEYLNSEDTHVTGKRK